MFSSRQQQPIAIGAALIALMAATRFHHFGSGSYLPDASLAVFLLAGFYLRSPWMLLVLLGEAALADYLTIEGGTSSFCVTSAYVFLIPTYAAMWLGGRLYRRVHTWSWQTLLPLAAIAVTSTVIAFAISNGSFYVLSGYFPNPSWSEYAAGFMKYLPPYLASTCMYIALAAIVHATAHAGVARFGAAPR
jgi:hypothetical protein